MGTNGINGCDVHTVATQLKADYTQKKTDGQYLGEVNDFLHECFKEQLYETALSLYEIIRETAHLQPYIFHQTACLHVAANDFRNAILEIEKAMKYDYEYTDQLFTDRDLQPLFEDVKFRELKKKWDRK